MSCDKKDNAVINRSVGRFKLLFTVNVVAISQFSQFSRDQFSSVVISSG